MTVTPYGLQACKYSASRPPPQAVFATLTWKRAPGKGTRQLFLLEYSQQKFARPLLTAPAQKTKQILCVRSCPFGNCECVRRGRLID